MSSTKQRSVTLNANLSSKTERIRSYSKIHSILLDIIDREK